MKKILILINTQSDLALSYYEVLNEIKDNEDLIITNCLDFACFDYLNKGYEVVVSKYVEIETDNDRNHKEIVLSELLENDRPYVQREIKKAHNIQKMIKANGIRFLYPEETTLNDFNTLINLWHNTPDSETRELHEFIGISIEEYKELFERCTIVKKIRGKNE